MEQIIDYLRMSYLNIIKYFTKSNYCKIDNIIEYYLLFNNDTIPLKIELINGLCLSLINDEYIIDYKVDRTKKIRIDKLKIKIIKNNIDFNYDFFTFGLIENNQLIFSSYYNNIIVFDIYNEHIILNHCNITTSLY